MRLSIDAGAAASGALSVVGAFDTPRASSVLAAVRRRLRAEIVVDSALKRPWKFLSGGYNDVGDLAAHRALRDAQFGTRAREVQVSLPTPRMPTVR